MTKDEYQKLWKMPSEELYGIVTERDSSPRKHLAEHILEQRRMEPLLEASRQSAKAAKMAAIAAFFSAIIALISLFLNSYNDLRREPKQGKNNQEMSVHENRK